ncbi:MAG TPA: UPF0182 family protein [Mycobacteriales bacterium]|nr:UPF0182 family protein [Mycobacteriales bacterium]
MAVRPVETSRPLLVPVIGAALVLLVLALIGAGFYTDLLWFREVGFTEVFTTVLRTRAMLFALFGTLMAVIVGFNVAVAHRLRPPFNPPSLEQRSLERYRVLVEPYRRRAAIAVCSAIGVISGLGASSAWRVWLQWRNATSFGIEDPQFHKDVAFYSFTYPFVRFLIGFGFAALILSLLASAATHYLYGGIRLQTQGEKVVATAKAHLSVLLGLVVLLKAVAYYVDQYGLMFSLRGVVQGASYTDVNAKLPALRILVVIALICAGLFIANIRSRRWALPSIGFALMLLSAVVIGGVYPAAIQQFRVEPDELARETRYIERNRDATLQAYGLDQVEYTPYSGVAAASAADLRADKGTLPFVRILDPNKLQPVFEQRQQRRAYYGFAPTLDVDRYTVNGKTDTYVLAARELDVTGIPGGNSWVNRSLIYTHGFGFVAAPADQIDEQGEPIYSSSFDEGGAISVKQPRIYYGEQSPTYSVVKTKQSEIDRPSDEAEASTFQYDGEGGVPIGGVGRKLAYALKFRERNLLLSGALTGDSRILYVRNPRDRVAKVAPYLELDSDPYPVAAGGRVLWVVDGYTTTSGFPYAQRVGFGDVTQDSRGVAQVQDQINYIRNSVKATVDAYDGTVTLYRWDEQDPVLKTWEKVFPDSLTDRADMPAELLEHVRYPEDLFKVQRELLESYHVKTASQLFSGNDNWSVPADPTVTTGAPQPPYYQYLQLPGDAKSRFQLTSPLAAANRPNLAAFFAASSDPTEYGRLRVFELPTSTNVPAPKQRAGTFQSDPVASQQLALLGQQGSETIFGNLLTLPVGGTLIYVQPVYVQSDVDGNEVPQLKRVFVGAGQKVGFATTLDEALDQVFGKGGEGVTPEPSPGPTGAGSSAALLKAVADAKKAFADGLAALKAGDFAAYGELQQRLKEALDRVDRESRAGSSSTSPSASSSSSPSPAARPSASPS